MVRPFLIFGLRGTLVERLHVRSIPVGMPDPDLTVGLTRVWLRPHMFSTLLELQKHCDLAIWSSTTSRNTLALMDSVFMNEAVWRKAAPEHFADNKKGGTATPAAAAAPEKGRFSRRVKGGGEEEATATGPFVSPLDFKFVWTREHTMPDEFRRTNAVIREDMHATVKDLTRVFVEFPGLATPQNTILIDDTPSKAKHDAANFMWMDSCEDLGIQDEVGMKRLLDRIKNDVLPASDVRKVLPFRVRIDAKGKSS